MAQACLELAIFPPPATMVAFGSNTTFPLGMVAHTFNLNTEEAEVGRFL